MTLGQIRGFYLRGLTDTGTVGGLWHTVPLRTTKGGPPSARPPLVRRLCHRASCQDTLQLTACGLHGPTQTGVGERLPQSLLIHLHSPRPSCLTCSSGPTFGTCLPLCHSWPPLPPDGALRPPRPQNLPWAPEAWIPRPLAQAATSQFGRLRGVHGRKTARTGLLPPLPLPCSGLPTALDRPRSPVLGLSRLRPWVRHPGEGARDRTTG